MNARKSGATEIIVIDRDAKRVNACGRSIPIARIVRSDGQLRVHHSRCLKAGQIIPDDTICVVCADIRIYESQEGLWKSNKPHHG